MGFGQFAATSQFFLYGKKHFTQTGWQTHSKAYEQPDVLQQPMDLTDKVFMITGANSGIGLEITKWLASKGATIYMVCRSKARAEEQRDLMEAANGKKDKVHVIVCDVSLESDVRECVSTFKAHMGAKTPRLDGVVCNAGVLLNEKQLNKDGVEVTFASHFLYGTYLLGDLLMPMLRATPESRFVAVSSGGMYNVPFPEWEVATSTSTSLSAKYDGQTAYAYAKRGQVLLMEEWAKKEEKVKFVSCHPGWTATPAVDAAYGEQKKHLEPMRTPWEGAEGIVWLCVASASKLESGAFYLDRTPQVKHMAGPFFTEGSFTKNSKEEVEAMMRNVEAWTNSKRPDDLVGSAQRQEEAKVALEKPLEAQERKIDVQKFMGKWYVLANIPTYFDKDTVNNVEEYEYDEATKTIQVTFSYSNQAMTETSTLLQRATVVNDAGTGWTIAPKLGVYLPVAIPYLIADCAEDYSTCIIGTPSRGNVWVMSRTYTPEKALVEELVKKTQVLGYDVGQLVYQRHKYQGNESLVDIAELLKAA